LETYTRIGSPLASLPPVDGAYYLIDYLMELGPANSNGMGLSPVSYSEIRDYSEITNTHLTPWDAHMLRHLSRVYVGQYNLSKEINTPAPYEEAMSLDEKRKAVVAGFKAFGKRADR
jgi:hypothetical protein